MKKEKTLESISIRFRYRLILLDKDLHNMIIHLIYITIRKRKQLVRPIIRETNHRISTEVSKNE